MSVPEVPYAHASLDREERNELVLSQLTEVHFIARRIHKRLPVYVPLEDLVHAGVLGLLEATEKYDSTKNVRFRTFAQFRIRGAILDGLRELDRASRRLRAKCRTLNMASKRLSMRLGRQPMEEEIAREVGLELPALRKVTATLHSLDSVNCKVESAKDGRDTRDLIESAPTDPKESPLAQYLESEMKHQLAQAMANLTPRESQVLSLYYFKQLTMQEIGSTMDLQRSRISQIHSAALAKLRAYFEARGISDPAKTEIAALLASN